MPKSPRSGSKKGKGFKGQKGEPNKGGKGTKGEVAKSGAKGEPQWNPPPMPSMPAKPLQATSAPSTEAQQLKQLMAALRKSKTELPQELQDMLQAAQMDYAKNQTKALHSAVAQLGNSRKALKEFNRARVQLHHGWAEFLEASLERWQGYTEDFRKQDQELQAKIKEAQDAVQQSIERFQECQSATGVATDQKEKETVEVSDEDTEMVTSTKVEETMTKMAEQMQEMKRQINVDLKDSKRQKTEAQGVPSGQDPQSLDGRQQHFQQGDV